MSIFAQHSKQIRNMKKKRKGILKKIKLYNAYYKRSGLYNFFFKSFLKLILILVSIIAVIIITNKIFIASGIDFKLVIENIISSLRAEIVLLIFLISESFLGWIPPDFFIVWAKSRPSEYPYLNVTFLATVSYFGGIIAYHIGEIIGRFPKVNNYIEKKYSKNFDMIKRWGGIVIVMAALFPLPYATISTTAGIVGYPYKQYILFGLTRYLRFYLYAIWIFWGLNNLI